MSVPLNVLCVEDSPADAELVLHELTEGGFDVRSLRVDTADAMRAALDAQTWDLVLSDYSMPSFSGTAALALLRQRDAETPFIIVSGTIGEETAVQALKGGANDFLVKGRLSRLVPAVNRELREARARRERNGLAEQLRQSQARSAFALEASGAGIWEIDLTTRTARWTEQISLMFGLPGTPCESNLDAFRQRVHPDDLAMTDLAMAQSVETDAPYRAEFRVLWQDGTVRWISAKGRVLKDAAGKPIQVMGISIDVTDRKELEGQLQHAQKLESLGQLAGGIAHDFNNVLTAILGFSELLLEDPRSADTPDLVQIKAAAESGRRLTRQLLAFSRQQRVEPAPVDLNHVVSSTSGILQRLVGERVRVEMRLNSSGVVWADTGQIEQVLVNLATNARDAMPRGGTFRIETSSTKVSDWVAARENVRAGDYVLLAVSDTGVGMSPETQARIFEPFFTTKPPGEGTGFGLATVYGIVRQSNGFIEVMSTPGQGTTFRIYLPQLDKG